MIVRLAAAAVGLAGALATAAPAQAHGADAPDGTNYRTAVTALTPAVDGLSVRTIEAGARLELTNDTGRTIEVLGYAGEPYLEVRTDGVYENVHSPATYRNRTLDGDTQPPPTADPALPPKWRKVGSEPVARWHDRRTHWLEGEPPAEVRADPGRPHRVRDWIVPLRDGPATVQVRGSLEWLPPPDPYAWWAGIALGVLAVGALGLIPARRVAGGRALAGGQALAGGRALAGLGTVTAGGGLAAIAFAVARQLDAGADGPAALGLGLLTDGVWPVLIGIGALAAAGYALTRRPAVDFAVTLAGTCLALFAGVPNAAVLARAVAPVPGPAVVARLLVAAVIATGLGAAAAGALRMRAAARTTPVDHGVVVGDTPAESPANRAP
ncbi:MAG TPA: hypothetical protein VF462_00065 [Micromonosporaceae bacterium]